MPFRLTCISPCVSIGKIIILWNKLKYLKNQPYSIQLHTMEGILLGLCACGTAKHEQFDILIDHTYLSITNIDIKHIYILWGNKMSKLSKFM